jgi:hypothetical protein
MAQRFTGHVRHHVEQEAAGIARIEEWKNVGVLQICRRPDFSQKPLGTQDLSKIRFEDLDRDLAVVTQVLRQVNRRHCARPDLTENRVPAAQRRREEFLRFDHAPMAFGFMTACPCPGQCEPAPQSMSWRNSAQPSGRGAPPRRAIHAR